jgi:hypothetical protein
VKTRQTRGTKMDGKKDVAMCGLLLKKYCTEKEGIEAALLL